MTDMIESKQVIGGIAYSTLPNLNTGTAWSEIDDYDITYGVEHGRSVAETANFMCRSEAEVAGRIEALGLRLRPAPDDR